MLPLSLTLFLLLGSLKYVSKQEEGGFQAFAIFFEKVATPKKVPWNNLSVSGCQRLVNCNAAADPGF